MTVSDELMRHMSKMALEHATEMLAKNAELIADHPMTQTLTGREALLLFAETIRSTNRDMFPTTGAQ